MKFSFTTLACPKWNLDKIISSASELGYYGIDFRGLLGNFRIYELDEFKRNIGETRDKIQGVGLSVSTFSSSVNLLPNSQEIKSDFVNEIKEYSRLCNEFGTKYIRIFGGKIGALSRFEALKTAKKFLTELVKIADDNNLELLIETHDDWIISDNILLLIEAVESPRVAILWDIHHPYRNGESPLETWSKIGQYVRNTHWKDSKLLKKTDGSKSFQLCLCGEGDIPYFEIFNVLKTGGYNSWLTFEWEKYWHPDLEEPEKSLPNFIKVMKSIVA